MMADSTLDTSMLDASLVCTLIQGPTLVPMCGCVVIAIALGNAGNAHDCAFARARVATRGRGLPVQAGRAP
jgi:hypothetical protein